MEGMDGSPVQHLMAGRLKSALPVASALLEPRVITDLIDKLCHRKQDSKLMDLPEFTIGETVQMIPLPGDLVSRSMSAEGGSTIISGGG